MERALDVYLQQDLIGELIQDEHGQIRFQYVEAWLNNAHPCPLSHSLPLRKEPFTRNECRPFFAGILPEEGPREIIARNLGISARNDFAMLEEIGGECAGAVSLIPMGQKPISRDYDYRKLSGDQLEGTLVSLPRRPLLAGEDGIRLSLAGAQNKLAVYVSDNQISIPLNGAPSTHIIKPAIARIEGTVINEALCMNLASHVGLPVADVQIGRAGKVDYLLVKRYDRKETVAGNQTRTHRLHQEDFCQALGIISENKYQREGGPSLKQCFDLVREVCSAPIIDLQTLLDGVIFNFLIGNDDAHGKNFSLLYFDNGESGRRTTLAPFYDLLSTDFYPDLSKKMAMKIGGEYESAEVFPRHFERLAEEAGLAKPRVKRRVAEQANQVLTRLDLLKDGNETSRAIVELIRRRCERTVRRFKE